MILRAQINLEYVTDSKLCYQLSTMIIERERERERERKLTRIIIIIMITVIIIHRKKGSTIIKLFKKYFIHD